MPLVALADVLPTLISLTPFPCHFSRFAVVDWQGERYPYSPWKLLR